MPRKIATFSISCGLLSAMLLLISARPAVAQAVTVTNTPLPVEESAASGFGSQCGANFVTSGNASCTLLTIPPNQVLVLETISCEVDAVGGSSVEPFLLSVPATPIGGGAPQKIIHRIALAKMTTTSSFGQQLDWWTATTPIRIYAAGGSVGGQVLVVAFTSSVGAGGMACQVSGHIG